MNDNLKILKEAPALVDYAIAMGWMSRPKKPKRTDLPWHAQGFGHIDKQQDDDEIQKLRQQLGDSRSHL
jgi:hypothetical protein